MRHWTRFAAGGENRFGTLDGDWVVEWQGDMFAGATPTDRRYPLAEVQVQMPCRPTKMLGLWNNFHERAAKEGFGRPTHPLYFLKANNSFAGHGERIRRPSGYNGQVIFEGELGIVIGRRCQGITAEAAPAAIFGYTCVNDVTARDLLREDPSFAQWTRAKGFDSFGVFGPWITTGIEVERLRVRTLVCGVEKQNYPVADMVFSPHEIVSRLSQDMTLEPGDLIACGTSLGAGAMKEGDTVEVIIDGVGRLTNRFD